MARVPPPSPRPDPLAGLRHLTERDRTLLGWLAEHYVLTTEQAAEALYPSLDYAQRRLRILHRIGAVSRFALPEPGRHTGSYRYTLGELGARMHPTAYTDPENPNAPSPRTHLERRARIARSPRLNHLLGVNGFFTALHGHARTEAGQAASAAVLRWWSEQHITASVSPHAPAVRPDAHGIWTCHGRQLRFFLEYDNATYDLPRLGRKIAAYQKLRTGEAAADALLLYVAHERRRDRLTEILTGLNTSRVIALAVHGQHPAGPVWTTPSRPGEQLHLGELTGT